MVINIKNMVCYSCIVVVKEILTNMGLHVIKIDLGVVEIMEELNVQQHEELNNNLMCNQLELLEDKYTIISEKIKNVILELVHHPDDLPLIKYSEYISDKLNYNYTYLSNIFTKVNGISIRKYMINKKVEMVKEILSYNDHNLTEISYMLNYSSLSHLSSQFKKVTGCLPSVFMHDKNRNYSDIT